MDFQVLPEAELNTYASTLPSNTELVNALYGLFEEEQDPEVTVVTVREN